MGIPYATYGLATFPHATHLQRPRQSIVTRLMLPLTGEYINDALAKFFEGLCITRLTTYTELNESLTSNQLGTKPCTQTHDKTHSLLSTIPQSQPPETYTSGFCWLLHSPPLSALRQTSCILLRNCIVGHLWHHIRTRVDAVWLRVLYPNIREHQTVDILRRLPEGSRLSPTLFSIFLADLIHELQTKFPHAAINLAPDPQHTGTTQTLEWWATWHWWPHAHVPLPARITSHATCLPGMERAKSYANQDTVDKCDGFLHTWPLRVFR